MISFPSSSSASDTRRRSLSSHLDSRRHGLWVVREFKAEQWIVRGLDWLVCVCVCVSHRLMLKWSACIVHHKSPNTYGYLFYTGSLAWISVDGSSVHILLSQMMLGECSLWERVRDKETIYSLISLLLCLFFSGEIHVDCPYIQCFSSVRLQGSSAQRDTALHDRVTSSV